MNLTCYLLYQVHFRESNCTTPLHHNNFTQAIADFYFFECILYIRETVILVRNCKRWAGG